MITTILLVILVSLIALRVPVSISIGIATGIALFIGDFPLSVIPRMMIDGLDTFTLLAVPFFILAGNIMNAGGVTERIFEFAKALFSPIRGGLAQVNVAASMIFAGMSGAALADLAGLGQHARHPRPDLQPLRELLPLVLRDLADNLHRGVIARQVNLRAHAQVEVVEAVLRQVARRCVAHP